MSCHNCRRRILNELIFIVEPGSMKDGKYNLANGQSVVQVHRETGLYHEVTGNLGRIMVGKAPSGYGETAFERDMNIEKRLYPIKDFGTTRDLFRRIRLLGRRGARDQVRLLQYPLANSHIRLLGQRRRSRFPLLVLS